MNADFALLVAILLKSLLLFALTGLALLCLRRTSAAIRHLVCLLTLAALLALPVLSVALPGWTLPAFTLPAAAPVVSAPVSPLAANTGGVGSVGARFIAPPEKGASDTEGAINPASTRLLESRGPLPRPFPWPVALPALWLLGALLASLRPLLGLWGIGQLRRDCRSVIDAATLALVAECAAALRLKRLPALCQAVVPVPMTWGWRRPVVLLPLTATEWPEDRCRAVLLHEMAHIRRRDWLSHRLADFACALYWFHPLVWLTARRLRTEGEIACDDLVVSSGVAAPEYARHLLEIARALPPHSAAPRAAIAMAQTSRIESRLAMILDPTRRRQTTRRVLAIAALLGVAALVPLAMLRPAVHAQGLTAAPIPSLAPSASEASSGGLSVTVPIELAGVTDATEPGGKWWSASGVPLPKPVFDTLEAYQQNSSSPSPNQRGLIFAFRLPQAAQNVTVALQAPGSPSSSYAGVWPGKMQGKEHFTEATLNAETGGARTLAAIYPLSVTKAPLRVGIAAGPWKVSTSETITQTGGSGLTSRDANQKFLISPLSETANGLSLTISTDSVDDIRVVAVDAQGRELLPESIGGESIGTLDQITARFSQPLSQIKAFRVETRPFTWTQFKDVALKPS